MYGRKRHGRTRRRPGDGACLRVTSGSSGDCVEARRLEPSRHGDSDPDGARTASGHGRPRRRWTSLLLVGVVVLALVAATYVLRYQPLAHRGGVFAAGTVTDDPTKFVFGKPARTVFNVFGSEARVGPFPAGGRFGFLVTLTNDGPFPVTVEGVEPVLSKLHSGGTQMFVTTDESDSRSLVPAGTFVMPSHAMRTVGFRVDVRDCKPGDAGATTTISGVRIVYRFLGVQHTAYVQLDGRAVTLQEPPRCS